MTALDIRSGTKVRQGALVGFPVGIALGFLAVDFQEWASESRLSTGERGRIVVTTTVVCIGIGALIGAGLDRWKPLR